MRPFADRHNPAPLLLLLLALTLPVGAQEPPATSPVTPRPRLVEIKVDGLSPMFLDALVDPDDPAKLARLPDPERFRRAIAMVRQEIGQRDLVPNLQRFFYQRGVRVQNMVSATVTLSSVAWSVIQTGQPSVIKRHMMSSRQTGYLRSHLDGFRDSFELLARKARKTNALWELDQAGVSLFADGFNPLRSYVTPWMYYRLAPVAYLSDLGKRYVTGGKSHPKDIFRSHMARLANGIDYPDFAEEFVVDHVAKKVLESDLAGSERYDYISTFFTIDHQHHVDPNPENLVRRMARLDRRIGRILQAVERSKRRDHTLVVLISDHGSEYLPGAINVTFPLTRAMRTRLFGGHTVGTVMAENAVHALTTPVQGIDFARVYEGPYSPYNQGPGAEKGYTTAFVDNFGNARAEIHLRNNDLNRLHLLLQARYRKLDEQHRVRLRKLLRAALAEVWEWLEPELAAYRDYSQGVRAWLPELKRRADSYWRDVAARLGSENERDTAQLRRLDRLATLARAEDPLAWLEERELSIPKLLPKKYFGPRNTVYQLSHYTVGLDEELQWVETTVDPRGRRVPMDYFSILPNYQVPNPPLSYERNPLDLLVTAVPAQAVAAALRERGWLQQDVSLRRALWVISTAQHNLRRGGQALVLEGADGRVRYLPIDRLQETAEGSFTFDPANELDPLGLLTDPEFRAPDGLPAFLWLEDFHSRNEWLRATFATGYTIAPLVFLDVAGIHTDAFIDNPDFQRALTGFPDEENKQFYLRGLRWKYASQQPDLLVWSSYLWNLSSKTYTAGGSHGGLTPQVARTTFLLWGGKDFALPAGTVITQPATTLDIVPTLATLLGMVDAEGKMVPQPGAVRERPFLPFAGQPLPIAPSPSFVAAGARTPAASKGN